MTRIIGASNYASHFYIPYFAILIYYESKAVGVHVTTFLLSKYLKCYLRLLLKVYQMINIPLKAIDVLALDSGAMVLSNAGCQPINYNADT